MSLSLRRAVVEDAASIATIQCAAWDRAYRHILAPGYMDQMRVPLRTARWRGILEDAANPAMTLVAERAGRVVGWMSHGPCRDPDLPAAWELWAVYVDPDCVRQGIGRALLGPVFEGAGSRAIALWVLRDNSPARAFYRQLGFEADGTSKSPPVGGAPAHHVRMVRR